MAALPADYSINQYVGFLLFFENRLRLWIYLPAAWRSPNLWLEILTE
jgi:hypothetical protein